MANFSHAQTVANTTWVVSHNLASDAVILDTMITDGSNAPLPEKILPSSVVATDDNTVTVGFSTARTGHARVVGNI